MKPEKLTNFEAEVLKLLLTGSDPVLEALNYQLSLSKIKSRQYTGHGFYVYFDVPKNLKKLYHVLPVKKDFCFGDVYGDVNSLKGGLGFLLWIKDGYLHFLEGYTYGETFPDRINEFTLRYIGPENNETRDLNSLRGEWKIS